jgi:hypothetical protein
MQQKRISNTDGLISPAEYARRRKLNRSTISRQIQAGKIPQHDGLIDPAEADEARRNNLSILRGRRKAIQEPNLEAVLAGVFRRGQLSACNGLRRPQNLLAIAETALGIGCALEQAVVLASWYSLFMAVWVADEDEWDLLRDHEEPDWQDLAARIGSKVTPAEIKKWRAASGPAVDAWYEAHPEEPAAISGT